jgi:hypothetical protein
VSDWKSVVEAQRKIEAERKERAEKQAERDDKWAFFGGLAQVAWYVAVTVAAARVLWLWWHG